MADRIVPPEELEARRQQERRRYEDEARKKANGYDPNSENIWIDDETWDESEIPLRPWVAPGYALRGSVTIVTGPPSAMKSSLMLAWGCAVALGREHGNFRPCDAGTAIIYNVEDDKTEQRRRLSAVLRQFDASPADIQSKVIRIGPSGVGTLFDRGEDGKPHPTLAMEKVRALIQERCPAVVIADPLSELHTCEENDNTAIRAVVAEFRAIAVEFDVAVILVHHTRKGALAPGDPDSARGASSLIGAARIVLTLGSMQEDDADALGLSKDRKSRSYFVRLDDAKQNYAAISDAQWFKKELYHLGNGEVVPAAVPWVAPDMWHAIPVSVANRILDLIDAGLDDNRRYSPAPQARDRAAWVVVQEVVSSLNEKQAKAVIATWIKSGVLEVRDYHDRDQRRDKTGLYVNPIKRPGGGA